MTMGRRKKSKQSSLWIATGDLPEGPGHPFYSKLNEMLAADGFDDFVEAECKPYYSDERGRPSIPPGSYFRMLMIGYFERIDSERGIAWRCADSLSLRSFLGLAIDERTPDHSSLSKIRNRLPIEVHQAVFGRVLQLLAERGLLRGKTVGVDATTLEANAALRSIVRRDTGESYEDFLSGLAKASGIETPTREDLARIDRKRKGKGSNRDWYNPNDPDAQITKMKDGRTHLAHKLEQAVDLDTGAIVGVTLHGGAVGDTKSLPETVDEAKRNLQDLDEQCDEASQLHPKPAQEVVADKGYHSNDTLLNLEAAGHRSYISEPDRGRRRWDGDEKARRAVYENRRRIRRDRGKGLLRRRGELLERPFEHHLNAGGMRRTHLCGHPKILKRLLIHLAGFDLAVLMRHLIGRGTPKQYADNLISAISSLFSDLIGVVRPVQRVLNKIWPLRFDIIEFSSFFATAPPCEFRPFESAPFSTAC